MVWRAGILATMCCLATSVSAGLVITEVTPEVAAADHRKILSVIVANEDYAAVEKLKNPQNDGELMAATFEGLGHEIIAAYDADLSLFKEAIDLAVDRASSVDLVLFYFAGHGLSIDGENFLLPVDFDCGEDGCDASDFRNGALSMSDIVSRLHDAAPTFVGFFDACRDNPLLNAGVSGFTVYEGLPNTALAYATAPGAVASDGAGENSPFTQALAQTLARWPGESLESQLRRVRSDVYEVTGGRQVPFLSSALIEPVSLQATAPSEVPPTVLQAIAPSERQTAFVEFRALGPRPGFDEAMAWLQKYERSKGLEQLVDTLYARISNVLASGIEIAAATPDDFAKGGQVASRAIEPPADSPLGRRGRRVAVVIGINDYANLPPDGSDDLLTDLRFAEKDATDVAGLLATGKMGRWEVRVLPGTAATEAGAASALKEAILGATEEDVVLAYFSGHGSVDRLDRDVFLMFQDSDPDRAESGLSIRSLERWLAASRAGQVILILDACRSGYSPPSGKGGAGAARFDDDALFASQTLTAPNRIFLTSSKGDQRSWEDEHLGNGVFTYFLIRALAGESKERFPNGFVDLGEAYDFTKTQVELHTMAEPRMQRQEPSLRDTSGNSVVEFPLAYRD